MKKSIKNCDAKKPLSLIDLGKSSGLIELHQKRPPLWQSCQDGLSDEIKINISYSDETPTDISNTKF
jgi:hypothetical protein